MAGCVMVKEIIRIREQKQNEFDETILRWLYWANCAIIPFCEDQITQNLFFVSVCAVGVGLDS